MANNLDFFDCEIVIENEYSRYHIDLTENYEGYKYYLAVYEKFFNKDPMEHFESVGFETEKQVFDYIRKIKKEYE